MSDWNPDAVRNALSLIEGRWVLPVLRALESGPMRRHVLHRRLHPISDKVLTETLRRMEAADLVRRTAIASVPRRGRLRTRSPIRRSPRTPDSHDGVDDTLPISLVTVGCGRPTVLAVGSLRLVPLATSTNARQAARWVSGWSPVRSTTARSSIRRGAWGCR